MERTWNGKPVGDAIESLKTSREENLEEIRTYIDTIDESIESFNKSLNKVTIKCHSQRCESFEKLMYKPPIPTIDFEVEFFNAIPISDGTCNNYANCVQYFETFFFFKNGNHVLIFNL